MLRSYQKIDRRKTRVINVGKVAIGGDNPIAVQTMTNTITSNVKETIAQIERSTKIGADLVRVSVPDEESTHALKIITKESEVPIIADIHFHYKRALEAADNGAACLRINPGNIGSEVRVKEVISAAKNNNCSIRIGVNAGSLEKQVLEKFSEPNPKALVESALLNMKILEDNDFYNFKISVKASDIFMTIKAYKQLASLCDYPLHLGITEAGGKRTGSIKSSIGIGNLLLNGIGDTIRVSLSDEPEEEVRVGFEILKSLGLRNRGIKIIACPSCARQQFPVIETVKKLENSLQDITNSMTVSIIG
ncbi:MAG: 4-hydroxy-3-methylbut-2-en-1-yl diphosphate synthase (flavodoxin), partial [Alphaproteobacteria bacterium MarineAlpha5_Bin4]